MTILPALTALLLAASGPGNAEVDDLITRGIALREKGKDAEAVDLFRRAYELSQGGRALAQLAMAEQSLGRWVEAETHLKAALDSRTDGWISANRNALEGALRSIQGRLASLEVLTNIQGATVRLNGADAGRTPMTQAARVAAGTVVVEVSADGYWPLNRSVVVSAGAIARETFSLTPRTQSDPSALTPAAPPPKPEPQPPHQVVAQSPPARSISPWVWVAGAGAVAGLAVGIAGLVSSSSEISRFNSGPCIDSNGQVMNTPACIAERDAAGGSGTTIAIVGFSVAAVSAATGVVLYFVLE